MFTLGATLLLLGFAGLAGKGFSALLNIGDPPREFDAKLAKLRLDIKKDSGKEFYTYIATFFIFEQNDYMSIEVPQSKYDEMMAGDIGVLTCYVRRRVLLEWSINQEAKNGCNFVRI